MIVHCRKKPVEVRAAQWLAINTDEVKQFTTTGGDCLFKVPGDPDTTGWDRPKVFDAVQSEWIPVNHRDWIIRGVRGEFYPCGEDVFTDTYEITSYALIGTTLG